MATLIKIDKNGTQYFEEVCSCDKCGGSGTFEWCFVNGIAQRSGTCFQCGGTGKVLNKWAERTPEYQAKLDAKRDADRDTETERIVKWRAGNWMREGFAEDGTGYLLTGNTYRNKDAIKAQGGRWESHLKGFITPVLVNIPGIKAKAITAKELCGGDGILDIDKVLDMAEAMY